MTSSRKEEILKELHMQPCSKEGGYFQETYRSSLTTAVKIHGTNGTRNLSTAIYYLVTEDTGGRNYLHSNMSDIIRFFHCGWPLEYTVVSPEGILQKFVLGSDLSKGDSFQLIVKGSYLEAARLMTERKECANFPNETPFALISEVVSPGFDYRDRTIYSHEDVRKYFPNLYDKLAELVMPTHK